MLDPELEKYIQNPLLMDGPTFVKLMKKFDIKRQELGISRNYVYMLRKGLRKPSFEIVQRLINIIKERNYVAPGGGFEPPTTGLTARRSTG